MRIYINVFISHAYIYRCAREASSLGGTHPHLGATRPRVGIAKLGFDAPIWQ